MADAVPIPALDAQLDVFLSPDWITQALRSSNVIDSATSVRSVEAKLIAGGFMADTLRLTLDYSGTAGSAPRSIVAKFPSSDPNSRAAGEKMLAYEREVNFYKFLAPRLKMRLADCYFAEVQAGSSNFALMLEDLHPADMVDGRECSLERAHASMKELALLHAGTWNDIALRKHDWILDYSDPVYFSEVKAWAEQGAEHLISEFGKVRRNGLPGSKNIPDYFDQFISEFVSKLDAIRAEVDARNTCLIHCDYRLTNLIYRSNGESVAIDWQTYHLGCPGFDTNYFIGGVCPEGMQSAKAQSLLDTYHRTLLESGVNDYDREQCARDSDFGVLYSMLMALLVCQGIGANGLPEIMLKGMTKQLPVLWDKIKKSGALERL